MFDLLHLDFVELLLRWHQYKLSGESVEESSVEYVILNVVLLGRRNADLTIQLGILPEDPV